KRCRRRSDHLDQSKAEEAWRAVPYGSHLRPLTGIDLSAFLPAMAPLGKRNPPDISFQIDCGGPSFFFMIKQPPGRGGDPAFLQMRFGLGPPPPLLFHFGVRRTGRYVPPSNR